MLSSMVLFPRRGSWMCMIGWRCEPSPCERCPSLEQKGRTHREEVSLNSYGVFRRSALNPIPHPYFINSESSLTSLFSRLAREGNQHAHFSSLDYHYFIIPHAFGMMIPFPKRRTWNNFTVEAAQRLFREYSNIWKTPLLNKHRLVFILGNVYASHRMPSHTMR